MQVFIHRSPTGYTTDDLEGIEELEDKLSGLQTFKPLDDFEDVKLEIEAPWSVIKALLSLPFFNHIWFNPDKPGPAIAYHCHNCGAEECAPDPILPEWWTLSKPDKDGSRWWLCPKCSQ